LLRPGCAAKIPVTADDGTLWFAFCVPVIDERWQDARAAIGVVEVVDVVPAQKGLGMEWFPILERCYDVCAEAWRMPRTTPLNQREVDVAAHSVEDLVAAVQSFVDDLPGGPASIVDLDGLKHLLHRGRAALNNHYRDAGLNQRSQCYYLELCLFNVH